MAMKPKSNDLEVAPEHLSEQEIRKAAKAALKKADRFWRLAEKAPSENYREHHIKQAKDASTVSAEKTRQANEIRARGAWKTGFAMVDSAERRGAMIKLLEDALALADELNDGGTGYLIERALDEARAQHFKPFNLSS